MPNLTYIGEMDDKKFFWADPEDNPAPGIYYISCIDNKLTPLEIPFTKSTSDFKSKFDKANERLSRNLQNGQKNLHWLMCSLSAYSSAYDVVLDFDHDSTLGNPLNNKDFPGQIVFSSLTRSLSTPIILESTIKTIMFSLIKDRNGKEYFIDSNTPIWVTPLGSSLALMITGYKFVKNINNFPVIEIQTAYEYPVELPKVQAKIIANIVGDTK